MANSSPFESHAVTVGGGLNLTDSPELLHESQALRLDNFAITGAGRLAPAKAAREHLTGFAGAVIGVFPFPHGEYTDFGGTPGRKRGSVVLSYSAGTTYLYSIDTAGQNASGGAVLWSGGTSRPQVSAAALGRQLFLVDEGRVHGLTRYDPFDGTPILQPTFSFDGGAAAVMKPRVVIEYNNMLLTAGYGTAADPNRPEAVRFSYLGLVADSLGAGDAGSGAGSLGLFDLEDFFLVGERGTPTVAMAAAHGRCVIATPENSYTLYGYSRADFQLELLDNQRGSVSGRAMIAAAGAVWGWGRLGPWRYDGRMTDLSYRILPELPNVGTEALFAAHVPQAREIRWYFAEGGAGDPKMAWAYNYERDAWAKRSHPFAVLCAGLVSGFWSGAAGETTTTPPGPIAAPSGLSHASITASSATASWTNGDTSPGTETELYRRRAGDAWPATPTAILAAGASSHNYTGLAANQSYDVQIRHKRSGQYTAYHAASFTTQPADATATVAQPVDLTAVGSDNEAQPYVILTWDLGEPGVTTRIYRAAALAGPYEPWADTLTDETSWQDRSTMAYGQSLFYKAEHRKNGLVSAQAGPAAALW